MASLLPREFIVATGSAELKKDDEEKTVWSIQCRKCEEIVRCRDCKYYEKTTVDEDGEGEPSWCSHFQYEWLREDGFCAWGERG